MCIRSWVFALLTTTLLFAPFSGVSASDPIAPDSDPSVASPQEAPGLGDPGNLLRIEVDPGGRIQDGRIVIAGQDAGHQLLVVGHYDSGQVRDLSRQVTYASRAAGVVAVDTSGYVTPLSEGTAEVAIQAASGMEVVVPFQVTHIESELPINFPNEIVPLFTKYGCNGGGCHGKSGGQNGFRLSLLGFEPSEDFEFLVKEGRGRRLFPASPDRSLLLLKGTAQLPHGGGQRLDIDSPAYRTIRRWISQGMPYGSDQDPVVTQIEVFPPEQVMGREASQQLLVVARYSDGTTEDITRKTTFDSNDAEMAEVSPTGLVTTSRLTGSVAVMARYQGHVGVFRATVPLGIELTRLPPESNLIDRHVFGKLRQLGLPPSELSDDSVFLRRVTVDIAGRLPTRQETLAFLQNEDPDKRNALIERLLASSGYADYFANKWNAVLRNKRRSEQDKQATFRFHAWIRQSLYDNKPYDQFVREILTATGDSSQNPPVSWYREVKDQFAQVEDTAQLFLGLRIQCARCHHHPFEKWSQDDYYGFSAYFARVGRKRSTDRVQDRIVHNPGRAVAQNPKTQENLPPTGLGAPPEQLTPYEDPRHALADWMSAPDNPFFARSLVNRYWKHFFGRGLVDPEDDMRITNPATHPELLDELSQEFIHSGFDLKQLVRTICQSTTYQLSAEPNDWNVDDKQNYSRYFPKRLNAEVLLDAIDQVSGTATEFQDIPAGTRAVQLPDNGFGSYFLTVFGRPESSSACECERSDEANLAQSLHLLNSKDIQNKLTSGQGRAASLASDAERDHAARLRELFLIAFSRAPSEEEVGFAMQHIHKYQDNPKLAYEDIVWALINTKEFLFNH